ncbi:hypothetical protein CXF83_19195 [Shewanella sp. Choline-02u-19]|uniref:hypothetical protein n=1 Tax=unclassified Shewanella TaxID=196818 RepID=UPI000C31F1DF|nr:MULTISPECIES: hypothetical protein [unclassified Shewanella]PKH62461.1 hypothetical protein CXF84_01145 [Shewanella sp. Bg11-22]PKI28682.1 hypothetical protein CXF83_19195 [Shewanella sp. Choline-02u-19]
MTAKKWTLTAISALILTACGGGDDSSGSAENGGASGGNEPQITLNTVVNNKCGIETPKSGVNVFVHNNAGDIIAEYVTNSAGALTADWPSNAKHITLTAENHIYYKDQPELKVMSTVDVEAGDLGVTYFRDDNNEEGCNCKQVEFPVQSLIADAPDSMLYLGGNSFELMPFASNPKVEWCDGTGPIDVQLVAADGHSSLAGSIDLSNQTQYTLGLSDFTHEGVAVDYVNPNNARYLYALSFDGWRNFSQNDLVFVYPTLTIKSYVWPAVYGQEYVRNKLAESYSSARHLVTSEGTTSPVMLWDPANGFADSVNALLAEISTGQAPYQYDFTSVGDVALTHMTLSGSTDDGHAEWAIWGGASGSMPDLKLPTALDAKFDSLNLPNLRIGIRGYDSVKPLNEWRRLLADRNHMTDDEISVLDYQTNYMELTVFIED